MTRLRRIADALARFEHTPLGECLTVVCLFALLWLALWVSVPFAGRY